MHTVPDTKVRRGKTLDVFRKTKGSQDYPDF